MREFDEYVGSGGQPRLGFTFGSIAEAYTFLNRIGTAGRSHMDRRNRQTGRTHTDVRVKLVDTESTSRILQWLRKNAQAPRVMQVEDKDPGSDGRTVLLSRSDSTDFVFAWMGALGREGRSALRATEVRIRTRSDDRIRAIMKGMTPPDAHGAGRSE